ncbi:DUF2577 family protein [Enterococcus sp. CR-Ec1]|uniref:DUF2577 family protein n=1 Tax=Enterococcus sp. CR-Ec1 TaxID=2057791 RepID=UPI000C76396D|nr:DUF2577 family protein [Enterococcus sp. CR-Ec1]AUJ86840.1 hypothetical protein CXM95_15730 [Enterococcus sp. CR-Ec1]
MAGEKLARVIKDNRPKDSELSDLIYGLVTSINPLAIRIDNRYSVGSQHLILSQMVKNLTVTITIDGKQGTAQVFRPLQVGDHVRMLRVSKGQKFYVLERS